MCIYVCIVCVEFPLPSVLNYPKLKKNKQTEMPSNLRFFLSVMWNAEHFRALNFVVRITCSVYANSLRAPKFRDLKHFFPRILVKDAQSVISSHLLSYPILSLLKGCGLHFSNSNWFF